MRALLLLLALGIGALSLSPPVSAKRGCKTEACRDRVWNKQHPLRPALASWYDADGLGGNLACAGYDTSGYFFAHRDLPCGARMRICFRRCVTATRKDAGPFVGPREFDLDRTLRDAVGFDGVGYIKVRPVRR